MSFSLLPIAQPVPAPAAAAGAAAPGGGAPGFEVLMAALFGETPEPVVQAPAQGTAFGAAQPAPAGQHVAPQDEDSVVEAPAEDKDDSLASNGGLVAASLAPAPAATPAAQTTPAAEAAATPSPAVTAQPAVQPPLESAPEAQVPLAPTGETEAAPRPAATSNEGQRAGEAQAEAVPSGARPAAQPAETSPPQDRSRPGLAADTPPPAAQAARSAARPAQSLSAETPSSAPAGAPTAPQVAAAQASAQPMMTAAAAAGVVSLRAGQTGPATASAAPVETQDEAEPDPKAPAAGTKGAFAAQPPSPFALNPAAPIATKADNAFAPAIEPAVADVPSTTGESVEALDLDSLDGPDGPGVLAPTASGTSLAEVREGARPAATAATVADLAAQVSRRLEGRSTHFEIQLTPEGLGRVDVRVDIDAQGKLTAAMAFDTPHAANEMRGRSGELMRALEQAGFDLSGGLSFNSPQDQRGGGQFADQAPEREAWQGRAFQNAMGVADEADTAAIATRLYQQRQSPTGVDLRI